MLIYIENVPGRDPAYRISADAVRAALGEAARHCELVECMSDAPDLAALARARYFVGSRLDTARIREHGRGLRMVHCTSAGVEAYLPLDWLPPQAVFTNSSGVHADKAGEFGLLALLMLNDRIPLHATSQRAHRWHRVLSTPVRGKTVLIYGTGALGGAVAERAALMGMQVWGVRRSGKPHPSLHRVFTPDQFEQALPQADFLLAACPLTAATRGAIGARQLALLPAHAGVVNMARAAVMDYGALADLLEQGRLGGAVLDVFDPEPLPADARWWDVPRLMVIPHVSSDNPVDYIERCLAIFARNVAADQAGRPLENVVDASLGY